MPYITAERRNKHATRCANIGTPGELNYLITEDIIQYLEENGLNYTTINTIVGALESAKLEFYRRIAGPYEDGKIRENGDVY